MASSQTTNYSLPQWAKSDRIQMSDFNAAMSTIDAALAAKNRVVTGSYIGDSANGRSIDLGFEPTAVFVMCDRNAAWASAGNSVVLYGGIALRGKPLCAYGAAADSALGSTGSAPAVTVTGTGFKLGHCETTVASITYQARCNFSGYRYRYLAIG